MFEMAQVERFERQLVTHFRQAFGDKFKNHNDDTLVEFVRFCCKWGSRYGIELEYDVHRFSEIVEKYGRGMEEEQPWIVRILIRDDISGSEKMDILDNLEIQHPETFL